MPRIPYCPDDKLGPKVKALFEATAPINVTRMMAHSDGVADAFSHMAVYLIAKSKIDPVLREIAIVRVGVLSKSAYELHQHRNICRQLGMSEELIQAIDEGPDSLFLTPLQADVIRYTDDLYANVRASDETFNPLRQALSPEQLVELTVAIGTYIMVCRFLETFDVGLEPEGTPRASLDEIKKLG